MPLVATGTEPVLEVAEPLLDEREHLGPVGQARRVDAVAPGCHGLGDGAPRDQPCQHREQRGDARPRDPHEAFERNVRACQRPVDIDEQGHSWSGLFRRHGAGSFGS